MERTVSPALYNKSLLPEAQRERFDVVLVRPRNPLNIGAAARAMANFGFSHLSVVAPFAPTWREARSAVDSQGVLVNAVESATLGEAVAGATLVVGTGSLQYRKPEQPVVVLPELAPLVNQELARGGRVALVFGPEKHGLTRDDLSWCHLLVEIPTDPGQPSMNLGQAVAVCLYELAARVDSAEGTSGPAPVESGRRAAGGGGGRGDGGGGLLAARDAGGQPAGLEIVVAAADALGARHPADSGHLPADSLAAAALKLRYRAGAVGRFPDKVKRKDY